nr:methyltransferase domain-containing protein [Acidimicrobiia bacterium]
DPTCRRVCDVGAGLSAASSWIAERGATEVVAVEPKARSAQAGRSLFPDLPVVVGAAEALPLRAGSVDGVTMLGLLSLIADLDATIGEALRVVRHGGVVGVTDLCAVSEGRRRDGPAGNEFRTVDALAAALTRLGADVVSVWTAPGDLATSWDEPGERVATAMGAAHGTDEGFGAWRDDQARLHEAIDSGDLHIATLVAERR